MPITQNQAGPFSSSPAEAMKLGAITDMETPPPSRRGSEDEAFEPHRNQQELPQTPPKSTSGSPHLKSEENPAKSQPAHPFPVRIDHLDTPVTSPIRLPSLEEFDQGVEALARSYGPPPSWTPPTTTLPSINQAMHEQKPLPPLQPYSHQDAAYAYHTYPRVEHGIQGPSPEMGYLSPPPECDQRHCNKKYTVEEGDFIIYAWHDKKQRWQKIKDDFARIFGTKPERTIQGLQAWYYRMNQRIPVWDQDGWLVFNNEDDLEPRYISIKCRERDAVTKSEPMGLVQRYPERAIHYPWVDPEIKNQARDWAAKRAMQYEERKERRQRKEQRRARL